MEEFTLIDGKVCTKCRKWQPVPDGYAKDKAQSDGLTTSCKGCRRAASAKYRAEHLEELRVKDREHSRANYALNREKVLASIKAEYHRDPEKFRRGMRAVWTEVRLLRRGDQVDTRPCDTAF